MLEILESETLVMSSDHQPLLTVLLMNFRSSSSRVRACLKEPSLRGGLNKLKNNPGSCRENTCASVASVHASSRQCIRGYDKRTPEI